MVYNSARATRQHQQQKDTPVTCSAISRPFQPPCYNHNLRVGGRSDTTLELSGEIEGATYSQQGLLPISSRLQKTNTAKGTKFSPRRHTTLSVSPPNTLAKSSLSGPRLPKKEFSFPPPPSHTCLRGGPGAPVQAGALPTPGTLPYPGLSPAPDSNECPPPPTHILPGAQARPEAPHPHPVGRTWGASHSASPLGEEGGRGRKSERKKRTPRKGPASQQSPFQTKGGCGELRAEPGLGIPPRPGSAVRLPFAAAAAASPSSSSAAAAASPTRAAVSTAAAAASTTTAAASAAAASDSTRQGGHLSPPSLPAQPLRSAAAANSLRPLLPRLVAEGEGRRGGRAGSPRRRLLQIKNAGWVASPLPALRLRLARPPYLPLPPPPSRSPALPPPPQALARSRRGSASPVQIKILSHNMAAQPPANTARSAAAAEAAAVTRPPPTGRRRRQRRRGDAFSPPCTPPPTLADSTPA